MAAMFQAQTANWEETQEKMSQLVLPLVGFCQRSSLVSNEQCFFFLCLPFCLAPIVRLVSTPILAGLASRVVASQPLMPTHNTIGLCLLVTFVTVVVKKVGF
jgi:hypothetical protein